VIISSEPSVSTHTSKSNSFNYCAILPALILKKARGSVREQSEHDAGLRTWAFDRDVWASS